MSELPVELRVKLRQSRLYRRFNRRRKWHEGRYTYSRFKCIRDGRYILEHCDPLQMPMGGYLVKELVWYRDVDGNTLPGYVNDSTFEDIWAD